MDRSDTSRGRYGAVAIALHWLIALLIAFNFIAAWIADEFPKDQARQIMGNHVAFGVCILLLTVVRIVWRITHRGPPLLPMARWESILAHAVHGLIYLAMLAVPLAGYLMESAWSGGKPIDMFGLFHFPGLPLAQDKDLAEDVFGELHEVFAYGLLALLALHVAGALKHQLIDRMPEMRRILPWG
jgi:cytochrome b561